MTDPKSLFDKAVRWFKRATPATLPWRGAARAARRRAPREAESARLLALSNATSYPHRLKRLKEKVERIKRLKETA